MSEKSTPDICKWGTQDVECVRFGGLPQDIFLLSKGVILTLFKRKAMITITQTHSFNKIILVNFRLTSLANDTENSL